MPRHRTSEPRDPELASLGLAIEALMRRGLGLTQTAVAHVSGLDVKLVNSYVRGQGNPPTATCGGSPGAWGSNPRS